MKKTLFVLTGAIILMSSLISTTVRAESALLTDPVLMKPKDTCISVVWFTEEEALDNIVILFENGKNNPSTRSIRATSTLMSRLRGGKTADSCNDSSVNAKIYRHEALVDALPKNHGRSFEKIPYRIKSGNAISDTYLLSSRPQPGTPMKILLTSDLQSKSMSAANFTKVYETVGCVDAIFANGDLVDVIDRAYDWFYADNAFFKVLQGRAEDNSLGTLYKGGAFLQNAPIYASLGNHDYMGRYNSTDPLDEQFNNPAPDDFNRITWEEIFSSDNYYMDTIGDVGLITLDINRPWRLSQLGIRGRYSELIDSTPDILGHGEFIFEDIAPGSPQYDFYKKSLASGSFKNSKYKVVMFHSPYSTLGRNGVHPFSNPEESIVTDSATGKKMTIFKYPKKNDMIAKYVVPLMEEGNVNLLFEGHTHIWNRFVRDGGLNILETSNVGNSYGGYYDEDNPSGAVCDIGDGLTDDGSVRPDVPSAFMKGDARKDMADNWDTSDFSFTGDLYGNTPSFPTLKDLPDNKPYLSSNTITAFSILDTKSGTVDSYMFDTQDPDSKVVKFDSFSLERE